MTGLFFLLVIIPSAIIHEYMHGWMADRLGDPTARYAGRLSLNPIVHIDPIGTIALPFLLFFSTGGAFMFAYAKPVPFNSLNLRNQQWGPVAVAFAGPMSNFILAAVFGLFIQFFPGNPMNLFFSIIVYANVVLGVFNLVPIPPLDGSKLLYAVLPQSAHQIRAILDRYGWVMLIIFMLYFVDTITPIIGFVSDLFTGGNGLF
ncbi:MAG: site-2 protease family protein [Candidatus Magasanikbacteria bacterium]|nr:site-2 protease family protein [Candidatus Magasanikbacteria bacterium]MBT5262607.1 site-2 protease family protein [Candidatus Magasanikbacteria bacterium]MBT5820216.1 site-2 protease family protein [Candidatus Magasanikbacteria bacterium]MBT6294191.1 site-2 protease family protein [Candidatus Magasanikbacteria bacterium]